jgi:DNA-binding XRE family transcriptional regulator
MKLHRKSVNLRQEVVGQVIGVSYQQIHKYEKGLNRISASALFTLSDHFNWPLNTIFNKELWTKKL